MKTLLAAALIVPLVLVASGQEVKNVQPATELQGKWRIVSFEADGKKEDETAGHLFVFHGDKLDTPDGDITFQLDPGKRPKQIDAKGKPRQGFPPMGMVGIYKLEGDKLTLCYTPLRKDARRPTEFKTVEGHRGALVVLERVKEKEKGQDDQELIQVAAPVQPDPAQDVLSQEIKLRHAPDGKTLATDGYLEIKLWDIPERAEQEVPVDLLKAQVISARRAYEIGLLRVRERIPNSDLESLNLWSVRWLNAERDLNKKPADQIAAAEAHLQRMKVVEAMAKQLAKTEPAGVRDAAAAEFYRVQAQIWLLRAKEGK